MGRLVSREKGSDARNATLERVAPGFCAGHWPPSELKSGDYFLRFDCRLPGWLFPFSKDRSGAVALPGTRCLSGWLDADLSCRTSLALITEQSEYR
jgi:hypothetical protein